MQPQVCSHDGDHRILPLVVVEREPYTVEMLVFDELALRQAPPCPIDGKPKKRASLAELEKLLGNDEPQGALGLKRVAT